MEAKVIAVSCSETHTFSKQNKDSITLIEGFGVEGDAHAGKHIKHIFLAKKDPARVNIRQIHLIQSELFEELNAKGFKVKAGQLGENITTWGIDLLALPEGSILSIGESAVVKLTALRNPCHQINTFQKGLLKAVVDRDEDGNLIRKVGVMGIILVGGNVKSSDTIQVKLPDKPFKPLEYIW